LELVGRRITLRTLRESDYEPWHEIRVRCHDWLVPWEPRPAGSPPAAEDRASFAARCALRERERQIGSGYGFGIFVGERLVGELTLSSIQRGPFQSASIGYWIDREWAGQNLVPEAVVVTLRFAFEILGLHRVEVSIIPRNAASRRVAEKLDLRLEGISERFLEIDGEWEDHVRYAMTTEEWQTRRVALLAAWLAPPGGEL
jgi:ribosomal-protein-alanine N-acetyltransferase